MNEWVWTMAIAVLAILNVFQLIYWSRQTQKLIDKLMSRNYAEYEQAKLQKHVLPRVDDTESDSEVFMDDDLKTLNNTMAGLI